MFKVLKKKESFGIHGHALTSLNNTAGLCIYCNTTKHTDTNNNNKKCLGHLLDILCVCMCGW